MRPYAKIVHTYYVHKNISSESVHTCKLGKKEQPDVIKNSEGENLEVF